MTAHISDTQRMIQDAMNATDRRGEREMYQIETLDQYGMWSADMVGDGNEFDTREEAEAMIPELRKIDTVYGSRDWADAEYRVVEIA